jgi:hypothetical protein
MFLALLKSVSIGLDVVYRCIRTLSCPLVPLCDEVHIPLVIYAIIKGSAEDEVLCRGAGVPATHFLFAAVGGKKRR